MMERFRTPARLPRQLRVDPGHDVTVSTSPMESESRYRSFAVTVRRCRWLDKASCQGLGDGAPVGKQRVSTPAISVPMGRVQRRGDNVRLHRHRDGHVPAVICIVSGTRATRAFHYRSCSDPRRANSSRGLSPRAASRITRSTSSATLLNGRPVRQRLVRCRSDDDRAAAMSSHFSRRMATVSGVSRSAMTTSASDFRPETARTRGSGLAGLARAHRDLGRRSLTSSFGL